MSALDRSLGRLQRLFALGGSNPPPTQQPVPTYPGQRVRSSRARVVMAVAAATTMPVAFGAALIPVRDRISQSTSLLMVLPVLVVALLGGRRLGMLAALTAAGAYDLLHTQPYYRPTINDPDDIVETVVLLAIGVTIGYVAESVQRSVVAARVRRRELAAVTDFLQYVGTSITDEELAAHASESIVNLLDAAVCVWHPDYEGTVSPVLRPDGTLSTARTAHDTNVGGALPHSIEIPVGIPPHEHGRFILQTKSRSNISLEERRAAASIAAALERCIRHPETR